MGSAHAYVPELAQYVADHWPEGLALELSRELLAEALYVAFQASLTEEEGRPTRFRLLLTPPDRLPEDGNPNQGALRLPFDRQRPLTSGELQQLSPSTPFETSLICAHADGGKLRIWGLAHSGPAWLAPNWGGRSVVPNWTFDPIIHVTGPGQLAVRCAGKLIGALERGVLVDAMMDVFESQWLPALFARERAHVQSEHAARQSVAPAPTLAARSLIGRIGQHMLRRAIQLVRGARHGGMILIVDDAAAPGDLLHGLRSKYRFGQDEASHRYGGLLLQILERVAATTTKPKVDWSDFALDDSRELARLEQAVFEWSRVIANLTAVDGAVVLDKLFGVLAFGAEVSAELASPARVWRALDAEGGDRAVEEVEDVGTRHRAAYRFVRAHAQGVAVVISQDGGVRFVAKQGHDVVFWQQAVSP